MPVRSLGYLHLTVTDTPAWRRFIAEFLGLMETSSPAQRPDSSYFRMDHFPSRIAIHPAEQSSTEAIGFEVLDRAELAEIGRRIDAFGIATSAGSKDDCAARQVTGLLRCLDPGGNAIEVFYGPSLDHQPVVTPLVSSFVTGAQGLGHVIVSTAAIEQTYAFYTEVLGFWERNSMALGDQEMFFLACNERHHTLGIMPLPGPGRLVHLMVEAATLDDVGLAFDRIEMMSIPIQQTIGRHTNDRMVSFYVYSPELHAIEFGWGGLRIPDRGPTYAISEGAFWGHKATPPPAPRPA